MDVNGIGPVHNALPVRSAEPALPASNLAETTPISTSDQVEISAAGRLLDEATRTLGVRAERLNEIRAAIEAGTYDTDEKLEVAIERMIDSIRLDERA